MITKNNESLSLLRPLGVLSIVLGMSISMVGCQSSLSHSVSSTTMLDQTHDMASPEPILKINANGINDVSKAKLNVVVSKLDSNQALGKLFFYPVTAGVKVEGVIRGLPSNALLASHIHENGSCADNGKAAGGHFNPTQMSHGHPDSAHSHAGALPNLQTDANGRAIINHLITEVSVNSNEANSIQGRALIIHSTADDYVSNSSGARMACGVIQPI